MAENEGNGAAAATEGKKKAEIETVKMSDGREVGFAGKRKMLKADVGPGLEVEDSKVGTRLDFRNGETRTYYVVDSLKDRFAAHGAKQKYGDETAGLEDIDDMIGAVDALDAQLQTGKWREEREGGSFAGTSVLLKALVEFSGKDAEQVKAFLKDKTQAEKLALRNSPQLKPIVEKLEAEKLSKAAKVDTGALLAGIAG